MRPEEMVQGLDEEFVGQTGLPRNVLRGGGVREPGRPRERSLGNEEEMYLAFLKQAASLLGTKRNLAISFGGTLQHVVLRRLCGNAVLVNNNYNHVVETASRLKDTSKSVLVWGEPESPVTHAVLERQIAGQQVDVLFITDRQTGGKLNIWLLYRDLVRDGGIIAFTGNLDNDTFVEELRKGHRFADGPIRISQTPGDRYIAYYQVGKDDKGATPSAVRPEQPAGEGK